MPAMDKTGPLGMGQMTGRGLGVCRGFPAARYGAGFGRGFGARGFCGFGYGRMSGGGFSVNQFSKEEQKEFLKEQRSVLSNRLEAIEKELEEL